MNKQYPKADSRKLNPAKNLHLFKEAIEAGLVEALYARELRERREAKEKNPQTWRG